MDPSIFPFFDADGGGVEPASATPAYNCIAWAAGRTVRIAQDWKRADAGLPALY